MSRLAIGCTVVVTSLLLCAVTEPFAFRCGAKLITEGSRRFEVMRKCGDPIYKEILGYTTTADNKREFIIEEWVYGPEDGFYYYLIFEGGVLKEIKSERE